MSDDERMKQLPVARRSPRYNPIRDLSIIYEGYGDEVPLQTADFSAQGMFVHTSAEFPEGAVIVMKFRLGRSNVEVKTRCEVRYCLPGVGIGVEFIEISEEDRQSIVEELRLDDR